MGHKLGISLAAIKLQKDEHGGEDKEHEENVEEHEEHVEEDGENDEDERK